jgi:hypothetical protein
VLFVIHISSYVKSLVLLLEKFRNLRRNHSAPSESEIASSNKLAGNVSIQP